MSHRDEAKVMEPARVESNETTRRTSSVVKLRSMRQLLIPDEDEEEPRVRRMRYHDSSGLYAGMACRPRKPSRYTSSPPCVTLANSRRSAFNDPVPPVVLADDRIITVAGSELRIWDVSESAVLEHVQCDTMSRALTVSDHLDEVTAVCRLDGPSRFATASLDGRVRVFHATADDVDTEAVLKVDEAAVTALCALPASLLGTGDVKGRVHIWNTRKEEPMAAFTGHQGIVRVLCVVGGYHLASGGDDSTVRFWPLDSRKRRSHLTQQTVLDCKLSDFDVAQPVAHLCHLGGDSLVSCCGSLETDDDDDEDGPAAIVRVWDSIWEGGGRSRELRGVHRRAITALLRVSSHRFASAGRDGLVVVWQLKQQNMVNAPDVTVISLRGQQDEVQSLALLDGSRIAAGALDGKVCIWDGSEPRVGGTMSMRNLTPSKRILQLKHSFFGVFAETERSPEVCIGNDEEAVVGLGVLEDGRLACVCRGPRTNIHRVDRLSVELLFSSFGIGDVEALVESALRGVSEDNIDVAKIVEDLKCLVDCARWLVLGKAVPFATVESSTQLAIQLYEAVASELRSTDTDLTRMEDLCDQAVAPHVHQIATTHGFCETLVNNHLPSTMISRLVASRIFRSALQVKYVYDGSRTVFICETVTFIVLMGAYSLLAFRQLVAEEERRDHQFVAVIVAFVSVTYFAIREIFQVVHIAKNESKREVLLPRSKPTSTPSPDESYLAIGRKGMSWASRMFAPSSSAIDEDSPHSPVRRRSKARLVSDRDSTDVVLLEYVWLAFAPLGIPRSWVIDIWNWIDVLCFTIVYAVLLRTTWSWGRRGRPPNIERHGDGHLTTADANYCNLVIIGILVLWLKALGFVRGINISFAIFVTTLTNIVADLYSICFVMAVLFIAFTHALYLRLGRRTDDYFDFHDDDEPSPWHRFARALQYLYILAFTGEFDSDATPNPIDRFYIDLFIFVVSVLMFNLTIAVISDSYHKNLSKSAEVFWRTRLTIIHETRTVFGASVARRVKPTVDDVKPRLRREIFSGRHGREADVHRTLGKLQRQANLHAAAAKAEIDKLHASLNSLSSAFYALYHHRPPGSSSDTPVRPPLSRPTSEADPRVSVAFTHMSH